MDPVTGGCSCHRRVIHLIIEDLSGYQSDVARSSIQGLNQDACLVRRGSWTPQGNLAGQANLVAAQLR